MAKVSDKELYSEIIKKVISKELTQKEAALKLEITDRQVRRLIIKYKRMGEYAFIHKNYGNPSHNKKISDDTSNEIINDYLTNFFDYGFSIFMKSMGINMEFLFQLWLLHSLITILFLPMPNTKQLNYITKI